MADTALPTTLRVLAIDDNPADLELLTIAFEALAVRVDLRTAGDGRDAVEQMQVELFRPHGWVPALILLDLSMPRVDGLETIARLRGNRALTKVPIAVLSGSMHPADQDRALTAGASWYLTKPANFDGLLAEIGGLLTRLSAAGRG